MAILAVVAAVVIPSVGSQIRSGDETRMQQDLTNMRSATEQFLADVRRYPKSLGQLINRPTLNASDTSLVGGVMSASQIARWRGPYLTKDSVAAIRTGFDATINALFTSVTFSGQSYLTISIPAVDTASARSLDRRMDDAIETSGSIQWATGAATTTVKFYVIPIQ